MKPEKVHWAKRVYLGVEHYAKNLALVSLVAMPVYSLVNNSRLDFSFLNTFSDQMGTCSTLADGAQFFTDAPIITNLAAVVATLGTLAKGVYIIAEVVAPVLLNANYSALFASSVSFMMAIPPIYPLIACTAIGVCAIAYWMSAGETEQSLEPNTIPSNSPLPLSTAKNPTELTIADLLSKQLPLGSTITITTPDGTKIEIGMPIVEAAINATNMDKSVENIQQRQ